jgi:predicted N-formylglutamate amidohydrolase
MSFFEPIEIISGHEGNGLLLVADHAMAHLPEKYNQLGLPDAEFKRHIAYDIGVERVVRHLTQLTNAPAVMARFSRLLIDPNRGVDDPTLVRQLYDGTIIGGNYPLDEHERLLRIETYYRPFREAVEQAALACEAQTKAACLIISIHSFTPLMGTKSRPWHVGLLWDKDDRVSIKLHILLSQDRNLVIGDNEPYDGALKGDTLYELATKYGRPHVLIEIRQDLIAHSNGQQEWADRLAPMINKINLDQDIHKFKHYGSRTD